MGIKNHTHNTDNRHVMTKHSSKPIGRLVFPLRKPMHQRTVRSETFSTWTNAMQAASEAKKILSNIGVKIQQNGRVHVTFKLLDAKAWSMLSLDKKEDCYVADRELRRYIGKRGLSENRRRTLMAMRIPIAERKIVYTDIYHAIRGMDHIYESRHAESSRLRPLVQRVREINLLLGTRQLRLPKDKETVLAPLKELYIELMGMSKRGTKDAYKDLALAAVKEAIDAVDNNNETIACTKMVKEFNRLIGRFMYVVSFIYKKARKRKRLLERIARWNELRIDKTIEYGSCVKDMLENILWANGRAKEMLTVYIEPFERLRQLMIAHDRKGVDEFRFPDTFNPHHPLAYFEPYTGIIGSYLHTAFYLFYKDKYVVAEANPVGIDSFNKPADAVTAAISFIENLDSFLTKPEETEIFEYLYVMRTMLKSTEKQFEYLREIKRMLPNIERLIKERKLKNSLEQVRLLIARAEQEKNRLIGQKFSRY